MVYNYSQLGDIRWDDFYVINVTEVTPVSCSISLTELEILVDSKLRLLIEPPERKAGRVWGEFPAVLAENWVCTHRFTLYINVTIRPQWRNLFAVHSSWATAESGMCKEGSYTPVPEENVSLVATIFSQECSYLSQAEKCV